MRYKLLILSLFVSLAASSQKPLDQFNQAVQLYQDEQYDSALVIFEKIYDRGKGDLQLIAKSLYNMGDIYMLKEDYKKAKKVFYSILDSNYDDMDAGGRGGGLMQEPYALYKNNSCKMLAEIFLAEKNYRTALNLTDQFHYAYPYRHFCGNEYAADNIYIAYTYARCYEGLHQPDEAIAALLPECLYNGLASNDDVVEMATRLIKKRYSKEEIGEELQKATTGINHRKEGNGRYKYEVYYTTVFETEIRLYTYESQLDGKEWVITNKIPERERYKYYFINSSFYKKLVE